MTNITTTCPMRQEERRKKEEEEEKEEELNQYSNGTENQNVKQPRQRVTSGATMDTI